MKGSDSPDMLHPSIVARQRDINVFPFIRRTLPFYWMVAWQQKWNTSTIGLPMTSIG
jgi:hypothetical protein